MLHISVILTGATICLGLTSIYVWTSRWLTSLLASVLLLYLWIAWTAIDLVSHWPGIWQCISTFVLLPQIGRTQLIFRLPLLELYEQGGYLLGVWGDVKNTRTPHGYVSYFLCADVLLGLYMLGWRIVCLDCSWWMVQFSAFFTYTMVLMVSSRKRKSHFRICRNYK